MHDRNTPDVASPPLSTSHQYGGLLKIALSYAFKPSSFPMVADALATVPSLDPSLELEAAIARAWGAREEDHEVREGMRMQFSCKGDEKRE